MPESSNPKLVGMKNTKPDMVAEQIPLDWEKLKSLQPEERKKKIVRRANSITQVRRVQGEWGAVCRGLMGQVAKAVEEGNCSWSVPTKSIPMPSLKVLQEVLPPQPTNTIEETTRMLRRKFFPKRSNIKENLENELQRFKASKLSQRVEERARSMFSQIKIDNIVAFGLMTVSPPAPPGSSFCVRTSCQHAVLITVLRLASELLRQKVNAYSQDPQYSEDDAEVLKEYGVQVVHGGLGHEMGWVQINENSLVMDFMACFPVIDLALEISRPAALYCFANVYAEENREAEEPFSWTLSIPQEEQKESKKSKKSSGPKVIQIPWTGLSHKATSAILAKAYKTEVLNLEGLDFGLERKPTSGSSSAEPPTKGKGKEPANPQSGKTGSSSTTPGNDKSSDPTLGQDGANGKFSHIGIAPMFYIKR